MHSARWWKKRKGLAESWSNLKEPASGLLERTWACCRVPHRCRCVGGGARAWRASTPAPLAQDSAFTALIRPLSAGSSPRTFLASKCSPPGLHTCTPWSTLAISQKLPEGSPIPFLGPQESPAPPGSQSFPNSRLKASRRGRRMKVEKTSRPKGQGYRRGCRYLFQDRQA